MGEPKGIFRKPIKIKSNTALKGSGKRKLMKQILDMYPKLEEHIEGLFPKKDNVSEVKIFTNDGPSMVYTVQNVPLFFELNNKIYPSVFLLWKHPRLVGSVSTHDAVIERLVNGADFMVPGLKNSEYDVFKKGQTVSVCSGNNLASLAVGIAALDSSKIASEQSGKALFILHTIQDELFKMASHPPEKPVIEFTPESPSEDKLEEENINEAEIEETEEKIEDLEIEDEVEENIDYDFLLKKYFLISLLNLPKGSLPILCNVFYKNKVLDEIPEDIEFDIRKTSYKKLSVFIKKLVDEKLITIEDAKGVQKLLTVNFTHPEFGEVKQFKQTLETQKKSQIKIIEMYRVTSAGLRILELHNYRKGDILSAEQVRACLNEYNSKKLDPSTNPDCVLLNDTMASVINVKYREIKYKTLFQLFFKILGKTYIIKLPSGEELIKNTLSSIQIKVASRCNNKKVTMISNLSNFGIDIKDFAHDCQLMAAASATINETPGQPNVLQFQIQGNHANMMRKILIEKYGVPIRFIVGGLEKEKKKPK